MPNVFFALSMLAILHLQFWCYDFVQAAVEQQKYVIGWEIVSQI